MTGERREDIALLAAHFIRETALQNDHQLDALLCAYTAFLWARDGWELPADPIYAEDGWIWFPEKAGRGG